MKTEIAGTGTVTISLKMPTFSEQFIIENVTVYTDETTALSKQSKVSEEEPVGEVTYYKEKSWLETFATTPVGKVKRISLCLNQLSKLKREQRMYMYTATLSILENNLSNSVKA